MGLFVGLGLLAAAFVPDMVKGVKREIHNMQQPKDDPRCFDVFHRVRNCKHDENGVSLCGYMDKYAKTCFQAQYEMAAKECVRRRIPIDDMTIRICSYPNCISRWLG